jgi:hypothetical protein
VTLFLAGNRRGAENNGIADTIAATPVDNFEKGRFKVADPCVIVIAVKFRPRAQRRGGAHHESLGLDETASHVAIERIQESFHVEDERHVCVKHENARISIAVFFPKELVGKGWELRVVFQGQFELADIEELIVILVVQPVGMVVPPFLACKARVLRRSSPAELSIEIQVSMRCKVQVKVNA